MTRTLVHALFVSLSVLGPPAACGCSSPGSGDPAPPAERRCTPGENIQACGKNLIIAHRGGAALAPEETMVAFKNSVDLGADVLELDMHATSDGVIVCMHDAEVDRTTDGTGEIRKMTLADIKKLDAGYEFTRDGGKTFPHRGKGVQVATLEEVLRAFPKMPFTIEIKQVNPPIADEVMRVVQATGMLEKVVIASFDDTTLVALRAKYPKLLTSYGGAEMVKFATVTEENVDYKAPAPILQAPIGLATEEKLALVRKLGVRIHVWTIDDRADMESLLKLGVHGIMTDDPALLKQVLQDLGLQGDKGVGP